MITVSGIWYKERCNGRSKKTIIEDISKDLNSHN